jgi:membrane protease YdiL (CAAX protease family)
MSFLLAARQGASSFARHAVGLGLVALVYIVFSFAVAALLIVATGEEIDPSRLPSLPIGPAGPAATLGLFLVPSAAVLLATLAVAAVVHRRPAATLVRADGCPRWRRAVLGGAVWAAASAVFEVIASRLYPGSYTWTFDPPRFYPLLVVCLLLVPLQAAAEELFFRGYLMQGLAVALRRGWAALAASSAAFAVVHLGNPEIDRFGPFFVLYYAGIGVTLALFTVLDDGLEVAIGAHTANNLWGALVVSFPGSVLDTPALLRMEGVPPEVMAALGGGTALTASVALWVLLDWRRNVRALGTAPVEPAVVTAAALPEG